MSATIASNHHRLMLRTWHEIDDAAWQLAFEYVGDDTESPRFVQYKGDWYDVFEFQFAPGTADEVLTYWDGFWPDTYFSGVLVKFLDGDDEGFVRMGRYYT